LFSITLLFSFRFLHFLSHMRILLASFPQFAMLLCLAASGLHAAENPCIITTIPGGAYVPASDGVLATDAEFAFSEDIQHAPDGSVYIADSGHVTIRRIRLDGTIERVVGNGTHGSSPDGTPARKAQINPRRLAFDAAGALLFTDGARIRTITPDGKLTTIAGNSSTHFSGDGGPAVDAGIGWHPLMAVEGAGSLLIGANSLIRRIDSEGIIRTIGGRTGSSFGGPVISGDNGPATDAALGQLLSLAVGPDGSIYFYGIAPGSLPGIRRIRTDGIVEPHPSPISSIVDIAFDAAGNLYASSFYVYRYESGSWVIIYDRRIAPGLSVSPGGELLVLVDDQVFRIENNVGILVAGLVRTPFTVMAAQQLRPSSATRPESQFQTTARSISPTGVSTACDASHSRESCRSSSMVML
jgi:hypothetical protein